MSTDKNLQAAFAGESQARNKYLAFAKKAEEEGITAASRLFYTAAAAEVLHAQSHFRAMGMIKSTKENLQAAIEGETYEFTEMYPEFISEAQKDGNKAAERTFHLANEAEKTHADMYKKILDTIETKPEVEFLYCPVCGHIAENEAPDKCPICGAPGSKYLKAY